MSVPVLPLRNMAERHRGLTHGKAETFFEAACVCLDRHHASPTQFSIENRGAVLDTIVQWEAPDERVRAAYANKIDTTEEGAYGCVIAAAELSERLYAVRRAETGTGADYYLGPPGEELDDLEACLRLEVSGTDSPSRAAVDRRLREKIDQARRGNSNLPAMAGVVGFQVRLILLEGVRGS